MTAAFAPRVFETSTSQGTGPINLAGAIDGGFQTFVAGVGNGNSCYYLMADDADWEVGIGTVAAGSPDTLSRDTIVASTNGGSAVDWGAGTRNVIGGQASAELMQRLYEGRAGYWPDTGAADAYAIAPAPNVQAYAVGQTFTFKAAHANTGAATLNVNGNGALAITKRDGALVAGDILVGMMVTVVHDGTAFQMTVPAQIPLGTAAAADLGAGGGEVPTNDDLGSAAYEDASAAPDPGEIPVMGADGAGGPRYPAGDGSLIEGVLAENVAYDNGASGLTAEDAQAAIDELAARPIAPDYIQIQDQKADGSAGGSSVSGSWQTRVLNTKVHDDGGHATLSSNQVTLAAGTYEIDALVPFSHLSGGVRTRWQNVTDGTTAVMSVSITAGGDSTTPGNRWSFMRGRFTIAAAKAFELQYQVASARSTDGLGYADALTLGAEIFSDVILRKVA